MTLPAITALPTPPSRSDDPSVFNSRADAFLGAFPTLQSELNAYAAALPATVTGTDFNATSSTSVTVGTGSKAFTIETGKQFQIGQPVRVASTASPANYMDGQVTAHNSGTGALTVEVASVGGSGTIASWTISLIPGSGGNFVTLAGTETLTGKSLTTPVLTGTASGTVAGRLGYSGGVFSYGDGTNQRSIVNTNEAQILTNKTLALGSNTISGTIAQFNAACSDADFATLDGTETLTAKTLTAPTINNGTITSATLVTCTIRAGCTVNDTGTIAAESPGFRGLPASSQAGGSAITFALTDASKTTPNTLGGWTIPANATVAFPLWTVLIGYNNSASSQNLTITTDTLRWAGTSSTGTRSVLARGFFTAVKVGTTEWAVSGNLA